MDKSKLKKPVILKFLRKEILDDVNQYAFVEADIMDDDAGHSQHQTYDITQDGNRELCSRIINLALSQCCEVLYPFTKKPIYIEDAQNDILIEPSIYKIPMLVPEEFSLTTSEYLEELIHNFIVYRILAHWLRITKPQAAAKWDAQADELLDEIKGAKSIRMGRVRRGQSPF